MPIDGSLVIAEACQLSRGQAHAQALVDKETLVTRDLHIGTED